jgi:hypothetical protein
MGQGKPPVQEALTIAYVTTFRRTKSPKVTAPSGLTGIEEPPALFIQRSSPTVKALRMLE